MDFPDSIAAPGGSDSAYSAAVTTRTLPAAPSNLAATLTNANPVPVTLRLLLGRPAEWRLRAIAGTRLKDGETIVEVTIPANGRRVVSWEALPANAG